MRQCSVRLAAFALGLTILAFPAMADWQIRESNVANYPVGTVVPDNTDFKLKPGERIRVLVTPSNQTRLFEGKTVADGSKGGTRSATQKKKKEE